ncbi:MAG: hypothetical protein KY466_03510 [Gemmatimonadetes bacterium]|nr:hypothetical protein [Gemmatimonadota bacterium]
MRRTLALFLGALFLASCAAPARQSTQQRVSTQIETGGAVYSVDVTRNIDAWEATLPLPVDDVWAAVPGAFQQLGLSGGGLLDRGRRAYGFSDRMPRRIDGQRASAFLDCGHGMAGPHADQSDVHLYVTTSVEPDGEATRVSTTVDATATPHGTSGGQVSCATTGRLERLLLQALVATTR